MEEIRALRNQVDVVALNELLEKYQSGDEWLPADERIVVNQYQLVQDIFLSNHDNVNTYSYQFGLAADEVDVYLFESLQDGTKRGREAVHQASEFLMLYLQHLMYCMDRCGWYDMQTNQDLRYNVNIDGDEIRLNSMVKMFSRLNQCVFHKMKVLMYHVCAVETVDEQLFDRIPMFTQQEKVMNQFDLLNPAESPNDNEILRVKKHVRISMLLERIKIRGHELFCPKTTGDMRPVYMQTRTGEEVLICAHCNRGKHLHKMPPEWNDADTWEQHFFRPKFRQNGTNLINTQSYVKIDPVKYRESTIESYINEKCKYGFIHQSLTKFGDSCCKTVAKYFRSNWSDPYAQHLRPHRHTFSFINGLLVVYTRQGSRPVFYPYQCDDRGQCSGEHCYCKAGEAPSGLVATKYFDKFYEWRKVESELYGQEKEEGDDDETPPFANMEAYLKPRVCPDTGRDICVTCERVHFREGECDNFAPAMEKICKECGKNEEEHDDATCGGLFTPFRLKHMAYRHIRTPFFDKIFKDQGHDGEVLDWIYVLIGRLVFKTNEIDQWQIFWNIFGEGGTGKTLLLKLFQKFFEQQDVALLNNNAQDKFVEGDLINKRLIIGPEVDNKLHKVFSRTAICAFTDGEYVCATIKGDKSVTVKQEAHICLVSNTPIYELQDQGGSLFRRKVVLEFKNKIDKSDGQFENRLMQEIGAILTKCVGLYLDVAEKHGSQSFWNVCPQYFRDVRERNRMRTNVVEGCIQSDLVVFHPEAYISLTNFVRIVKEYASMNSVRTQLRTDELDRVMKAFENQHKQVVQVHENRPIPGSETRTSTTKWLVGVGDSRIENTGWNTQINTNAQPQHNHRQQFQQALATLPSGGEVSEEHVREMLDMVVQKYSTFASADDFFNQQPYQSANNNDDNYY